MKPIEIIFLFIIAPLVMAAAMTLTEFIIYKLTIRCQRIKMKSKGEM
jgi:hypothetical protein